MPFYLVILMDITNFACLILIENFEFSKSRLMRQDSNESIWSFSHLKTAISNIKGKLARKKQMPGISILDTSYGGNLNITDRKGLGKYTDYTMGGDDLPP